MSLMELKQRRETAMAKADAILKSCEIEKRALTPEESETVDGHMDQVNALNPQIKRIEKMNTIRSTFGAQPLIDGRENLPGSPNRPRHFADVDAFVRTGRISDTLRAGMVASLSEGSDLGVAIPPYALEAFRVDSPMIAPFEAAGATIFASENFGMTKVKVPFVLPGNPATTYAEESGPTTTSDATVVGVTLTPAKWALLTKLSEESDADIPGLEGAVTQEGTRRMYKSTSDAATTALLSSLYAAGSFVSKGSNDFLTNLLDLEAAVNPVFSGPTNVFMCSRAGLSRLRNTRDLQDRPIFDPVSRTLIGYRTVINDALADHIVFGNFGEGCFLSYSAFFVMRVLEAYREEGKIGVRFARRMASAFFSDASHGSIQPLYSLNLDIAGS